MTGRAIARPGRPRPRGYSEGYELAGTRTLFVAGQVGLRPGEAAGDFVAQFGGALAAVCEVVAAAGGTPERIGRLTIYVKNMGEYLAAVPRLGAAYRAALGAHYPAMAVVEVTGFVAPEIKVEIEATAVLP